jgi:integrase
MSSPASWHCLWELNHPSAKNQALKFIDDMSNELATVLKEHVAQLKKEWLAKETPDGEAKKPEPDWLSPNEEGSWPDYSNIANRHFYPCLDKPGLHHRRPYDLHHTFASLLLTAGSGPQRLEMKKAATSGRPSH